MTEKIVTVERIFNANRKIVWRALTEKELMKLWYFDLSDFQAQIGFKFEFGGCTKEGTQYNHICEVIEVITEEKLMYSWQYEGYEGITYVTFELFDENDSTLLKLTHRGFETFPSIPDFAIHNFEAGWNDIINNSLTNFLATNNLYKLPNEQ